MTVALALALFDDLELAGLRAPYADADAAGRLAALWVRLLGHLAEPDARRALDAYLASDRGVYWPKPAELLAHCPALAEEEEEKPWPMARLDPGVALAIHAQVADERAAGQWPTEAAMLGRFAELAEAALREAA